eukprot:EG_transcript_23327
MRRFGCGPEWHTTAASRLSLSSPCHAACSLVVHPRGTTCVYFARLVQGFSPNSRGLSPPNTTHSFVPTRSRGCGECLCCLSVPAVPPHHAGRSSTPDINLTTAPPPSPAISLNRDITCLTSSCPPLSALCENGALGGLSHCCATQVHSANGTAPPLYISSLTSDSPASFARPSNFQ